MPKDIRYLKGVGEKRAELFAKKGIKTVEDLLYYFPRSHEDRTEKKDIADCVEGETVCVSITVFSPVRFPSASSAIHIWKTAPKNEDPYAFLSLHYYPL